jgi:hypothetical protein
MYRRRVSCGTGYEPQENRTSSQKVLAFSGTNIQPALALVVARPLAATTASRAAADSFDFRGIGLSIPVVAKPEWLARQFDEATAKPVRVRDRKFKRM